MNYEDITALIHEYKTTKDQLQTENKLYKELSISYNALSQHFGDLHLNSIRTKIQEKKDNLDILSNTLLKLEETLIENKSETLTKLKEHHKIYMKLMSVLGYKPNTECDSFIVEMAKLFYANPADCYDLRAEPPISGIVKKDIPNLEIKDQVVPEVTILCSESNNDIKGIDEFAKLAFNL